MEGQEASDLQLASVLGVSRAGGKGSSGTTVPQAYLGGR